MGNLEPTLITDNYLVVSSFNNDLHWIKPRSNNYCVYERGSQGLDVYGLDSDKCFKSPNLGYNIYDYLTYIIENYTTLPECVLFVKGNIFPRHITEQYFDKIANNKIFTPIVDAGTLNCSWPMSTMIGDTLYCELNTSWYLNHHPVKYFNSFNEFLQFVYVAPLLPRYVGFAPGANYIVPRNNILRVPRIVYENLKTFVSYIALPGEAHILERALPIIWNSGYSFSEKILSSMGDMENLPVLSRRNRTWRDYMDGMEYRAQKLVADFLGRLHFW